MKPLIIQGVFLNLRGYWAVWEATVIPLIKEDSLNHNMKPLIIQGVFLNLRGIF